MGAFLFGKHSIPVLSVVYYKKGRIMAQAVKKTDAGAWRDV